MNEPGPPVVRSEPVEGDRLDEDQIALVIRRASELDGQALVGRTGLDLVRLEEAAVEAGLSRQSVRRAVAELRAGTLTRPARRTASRPAPGRLTVTRMVPGPQPAVQELVRQFLDEEQFDMRRDMGDCCHWRRRHGAQAWVRLSVDRVWRRMVLSDVDRVETAAVEEPGSDGARVLVSLTADLRPLQRARRATLGKGAVGAALVGAVALAATVTHPDVLVALPAATASGVVGGHLIGSARFRSRVDDLETALEGFLDRVERRVAS